MLWLMTRGELCITWPFSISYTSCTRTMVKLHLARLLTQKGLASFSACALNFSSGALISFSLNSRSNLLKCCHCRSAAFVLDTPAELHAPSSMALADPPGDVCAPRGPHASMVKPLSSAKLPTAEGCLTLNQQLKLGASKVLQLCICAISCIPVCRASSALGFTTQAWCSRNRHLQYGMPVCC